MNGPTQTSAQRPAKYRLVDLRVPAVGVVDAGANQRPFFEILKAEWSTAYVNDLPDSAFLYVESGGSKDADGKTTPRTLRHFPYRDAAGNVDLPHLRNALARAPQSSLPQSVIESVQAEARRILEREQATEKADKMALTLPAEAKDMIAKGIAASVEKLLALSAMLDAATVDDMAPVPSELADTIGAVSQELGALAQQFAPTQAPAAMPEGEPPAPSPEEMALAKSLHSYLEKAAPRMPLQAFHKLNTRVMDVFMGLFQEFAPHFAGGDGAIAAPVSAAAQVVDDKAVTKSLDQDALTKLFDERIGAALAPVTATVAEIAKSRRAPNGAAFDAPAGNEPQPTEVFTPHTNLSAELRRAGEIPART